MLVVTASSMRTFWIILPSTLVTTTVLVFLLLIIQTRLALGRMLSWNWCVNLMLELVVPLLDLDRLLWLSLSLASI